MVDAEAEGAAFGGGRGRGGDRGGVGKLDGVGEVEDEELVVVVGVELGVEQKS